MPIERGIQQGLTFLSASPLRVSDPVCAEVVLPERSVPVRLGPLAPPSRTPVSPCSERTARCVPNWQSVCFRLRLDLEQLNLGERLVEEPARSLDLVHRLASLPSNEVLALSGVLRPDINRFLGQASNTPAVALDFQGYWHQGSKVPSKALADGTNCHEVRQEVWMHTRPRSDVEVRRRTIL